MNEDFFIGLLVGIVFTIIAVVVMAILHAAGNADDESEEFYRQHLVDEWEKRNPPEEQIIMHCESPGCNNELVHRQEMLWGKCDSCMFPLFFND